MFVIVISKIIMSADGTVNLVLLFCNMYSVSSVESFMAVCWDTLFGRWQCFVTQWCAYNSDTYSSLEITMCLKHRQHSLPQQSLPEKGSYMRTEFLYIQKYKSIKWYCRRVDKQQNTCLSHSFCRNIHRCWIQSLQSYCWNHYAFKWVCLPSH
jgi:hypothetical protein